MGFYLYLLVALGGAFGGFISTLAGLGSVITLYVLMEELGLPPDVANATNRLGIMAMCVTALPSFHKKGHLKLEKNWKIIVPMFIGALGGAFYAMEIDNQQFRAVFKYLLLVILVLVVLNPKKWTQETDPAHQLNWWFALPIFLLMGFYAGFIQLGTGIFFVVFLAMFAKYSLVDANGVKLAAFALYTIFIIIIFALNGLVDWWVGLSLAIGQGIGAYVAAQIATGYPKANVFVRYLLIFVIVMAIVKLFKLYEYLNIF